MHKHSNRLKQANNRLKGYCKQYQTRLKRKPLEREKREGQGYNTTKESSFIRMTKTRAILSNE
jgi:hypothetical protein